MDTDTQIQTRVSAFRKTNTVEKGVSPTILPPAMGRVHWLLDLGTVTGLGEVKLNPNLINSAYKFDRVSHPIRVGGIW